jgi:hypothetical protein
MAELVVGANLPWREYGLDLGTDAWPACRIVVSSWTSGETSMASRS